MTKDKLSIVVPVLNEASTLLAFLNTLESNSFYKNEVIIVDGGSTDGTLDLIAENKQLIKISSPKGRAIQMNAGAKIATSSWLYFIHVDTLPPKHFDAIILKGFQANQNHAGCFRLKFNALNFWLNLSAYFTRFNFKLCRGGDQSLFISKSNFEELGKFNEDYIICEDVLFINQIYKKKKFTVYPVAVETSARRFKKNGVLRLFFHFSIIHFMCRINSSPEKLYDYYQKHIR